MKHKLILIAFMLLGMNADAQFLYSHFDGWNDEFNHCDRLAPCMTFDKLYVNPSGPCPGCRWRRIGTPSKASSTEVYMWGQQSGRIGEGLFTDFNFTPGKRYKIRVGVSTSDNQWGRLSFFAVSGLMETPDAVDVCCHEPFLEDLGNPGYADFYYYNNVSSGPDVPGAVPTLEKIATMRPGYFPAGPVTEKFLMYSPVSSHSQFAIYADGHPNIGAAQYNVVLDYLIIEEVCEADWGYMLNTQNILNVLFHPPYNPYTTQHWDMGDGNTNNNNVSFYHSYPSTGTYTPCVEQQNGENEDWLCKVCQNICLNDPQHMPGDGPDDDWELEIPADQCTSSDFYFYAGIGSEVGLSPLSGSEPYYRIDWGDGTFHAYHGLAMSSIHDYNLMSGTSQTFTVCLETGLNCKTCIDVCISEPYEQLFELDDREWEIGEGKPGKTTSIPANYTGENKMFSTVRNVRLIPNPALQSTELRINASMDEDASIVITDITGRVVRSLTHKLVAGNNNIITLDLAELVKGVYMVEVTTGTGTVTEKLMKQ